MCLRLYCKLFLSKRYSDLIEKDILIIKHTDYNFIKFKTEYFDLKRKKKIQKAFKKEIEILKYIVNKIQKLLKKCQTQSSKK